MENMYTVWNTPYAECIACGNVNYKASMLVVAKDEEGFELYECVDMCEGKVYAQECAKLTKEEKIEKILSDLFGGGE